MGFLLAANDLLVLFIAIAHSKLYFGEDRVGLYESINGYGLEGAHL